MKTGHRPSNRQASQVLEKFMARKALENFQVQTANQVPSWQTSTLKANV